MWRDGGIIGREMAVGLQYAANQKYCGENRSILGNIGVS